MPTSKTPSKVVVDLEGLNLTDEEVSKIGASVQSAVLRELGGFKGTKGANLGVLPGLKDPRWIGLIIRDLSAFNVNAATINGIRDGAGL